MLGLKIKDNVNLKELEKFGFVMGGAYLHKNVNNKFEYSIDFIAREIEIYGYESSIFLDDTIYDLIKADLVEVW